MNKILDGLALLIIAFMLVSAWVDVFNYKAEKYSTASNIISATLLVAAFIWAILRFKGM